MIIPDARTLGICRLFDVVARVVHGLEHNPSIDKIGIPRRTQYASRNAVGAEPPRCGCGIHRSLRRAIVGRSVSRGTSGGARVHVLPVLFRGCSFKVGSGTAMSLSGPACTYRLWVAHLIEKLACVSMPTLGVPCPK